VGHVVIVDKIFVDGNVVVVTGIEPPIPVEVMVTVRVPFALARVGKPGPRTSGGLVPVDLEVSVSWGQT